MKPSWLKTRKNLEQLWVRSRWVSYRWRIQLKFFLSFTTMYTNGFFHLKFRYLHGTIVKIIVLLLFLAALEANFYTMKTPSPKWSSVEVEEPNYHKNNYLEFFENISFHRRTDETWREDNGNKNKFRLLTCSTRWKLLIMLNRPTGRMKF
jgi:hypothetical protein